MEEASKTANLVERERDLFSSHHGAFQYEDRAKIMAIALAREARGEMWIEVVRDFHTAQRRYWGFQVVPFGHINSKKPKTEAQLGSREVFAFFWAAAQSLIILKLIILYFGLNYSKESDDAFGGGTSSFEHSSGYGWGLAVSVAISFGGLIVFAIRKSRGKEWT